MTDPHLVIVKQKIDDAIAQLERSRLISDPDQLRIELLLAGHHITNGLWALAKIGGVP